MRWVRFDQHKDSWVLTSVKQVRGGPALDALPAWVVPREHASELAEILEKLMSTEPPIVPATEWDQQLPQKGVREEAAGARSWRTYIRDVRVFYLEERGDALVLAEWRRDGLSFSANPLWEREFPKDRFDAVAEYAVQVTTVLGTTDGVS